MARTHLARALVATAAAIGLTAAVAATATARPPDPNPGDHQGAISMPNAYGSKFYDNEVTGPGGDYIAFAGASLDDYIDVYCPDCVSEPDTAFGTLHVKPDGPVPAVGSSDRFWVNAANVPVEIYEAPGRDAYAYLDAVCDGNVEPELYASGKGVLWMRGTTEYIEDPATGAIVAERHEENGVSGSLRTVDGARIQIRGYADVDYWVVSPGTPDQEVVFFGPPDKVTLDIR